MKILPQSFTQCTPHYSNNEDQSDKCGVCWRRPEKQNEKGWVAHSYNKAGEPYHPMHEQCAKDTIAYSGSTFFYRCSLCNKNIWVGSVLTLRKHFKHLPDKIEAIKESVIDNVVTYGIPIRFFNFFTYNLAFDIFKNYYGEISNKKPIDFEAAYTTTITSAALIFLGNRIFRHPLYNRISSLKTNSLIFSILLYNFGPLAKYNSENPSAPLSILSRTILLSLAGGFFLEKALQIREHVLIWFE